MIKFFAEELSNILLNNNIIKVDERECYIYGLEALISKTVLYVSIFIVAFLTKTLLISMIFIFCYIFLRQYSGGYHCKTAEVCLLLSLLIYFMMLFFYQIQGDNISNIILISSAVSCIIIFILSPIDSENKPLNNEEKKKYKIFSILISISYFLMILVFYFLKNQTPCCAISYSLIADTLLLIPSINKKRKEEST